MGVLKFPKLGFLLLQGPIALCSDLRLRWGLKKSCNPCQVLSNGMSHATYTQGNWGDSRLLMFGSQIGNLTPGSSFGHNLCFKCPNGSCKPILDIYVSRDFQLYKKLINPMGFDPYNHSLKRELTRECKGSFPHTLPHSWEHEMWLSCLILGPHLHKPLPWSRAQD